LDVDVYEFLRPQHPTKDENIAFIQTYTEKAAKTASEAVIRSLDTLCKQYIP
jgi:DNA-directed RNA polymerase subunit L